MKKHEKNNKSHIEIEKLIEEEKKVGLEVFRKTDFAAKLEMRINASSKPKHILPYWLRKPVPIAVLLLMIIVSGLVLRKLIVPYSDEKSVAVIEKFLIQALNMQKILQAQESQELAFPPGIEEFFRFEWSIQRVILSTQREVIPDEDIPFLIYKVMYEANDYMRRGLASYPGEENELKDLQNEVKNLREQNDFRKYFFKVLKKIGEV